MEKLKIVINTNLHYRKPFTSLMQTIVDSNFNNFHNIIVVISEADENSGPELINLSNFVDFETNYEVVRILTTLNSYDYAGFNALHRYKNHELIEADNYFYLLDTTSVVKNFHEKIDELLLKYPNKISIQPKLPNANIILFKNNFIDLYSDTFNRSLTKQQAALIENGQMIIANDKKMVNPLNTYCTVEVLPEREFHGYLDPYDTGHQRLVVYYPYFGVYKYIFWGGDGDIKNNITETFPQDPIEYQALVKKMQKN